MNARTLIALLLAATAAGCAVENNYSVVISSVCYPPTPTTSGCSYPATCSATLVGNPWVDTTYALTGGTLYLPFQIDNQRPDNAAGREGGVNTADARVTGFKLKYFSNVVAIPALSVDWTTLTVPSIGSAVTLIPVVPLAVAAQLAASPGLRTDIRVEIRATGTYNDGQKFESGPFSMVVDVLNGVGSGVFCPTTTPTLVGVCPQAGQTAVPLCQ
jgi:hypothetical protein